MKSTILQLSHDLLQQEHQVRLRIQGYSMYPYLKTHDLLYISGVSINEIQQGDVVVFSRGNRWIAHRCLERGIKDGMPYIRSKGDTCLSRDEYITKSNYIGIGLKRKRRTEEAVLCRKDRYSRFIVRGHPFVHVGLHYFIRICRAVEKISVFLRIRSASAK